MQRGALCTTVGSIDRWHHPLGMLRSQKVFHHFERPWFSDSVIISKLSPEPMYCRPKNKKQTSVFIHLPTTNSTMCYSAWSTDNKNVIYKFLSQFNLQYFIADKIILSTLSLILCKFIYPVNIEFFFFILTDRLLFDVSMRNKKNYAFL